jgi:hypothetical protein
MRTLTLWLLLAGCGESDAVVDDLAVTDMAFLQQGEPCPLIKGSCAPGLKCCLIPCTLDGGCIDDPSTCQPQPPPPGYFSCM